MTAAKNSDSADSAIGNITGSNSVNVFLGLGLPWVIASTYWSINLDKDYEVPAGSLSFSVYVFLIVAVLCFAVLVLRRCVSFTFSIFNFYFCLVCIRRTWRTKNNKIPELLYLNLFMDLIHRHVNHRIRYSLR